MKIIKEVWLAHHPVISVQLALAKAPWFCYKSAARYLASLDA